jgi:hypothetical protein
MRQIFTFFFLLAMLTASLADDTVLTDTPFIQRYHGRMGIWMHVSSMGDLKFRASSHGVTVSDVRTVNGRLYFPSHLFIPFSHDVTKKLIDEGRGFHKSRQSQLGFIWPIIGANLISSSFGMRLGLLHTGIDLPAPRGFPIVASKDGYVISASYIRGHGNSIYLEHRGGAFTRYSHCSVFLVKKGEYVKQGQVIGLVGSTGRSTGNHLHFEVRYNNVPLNPLDFLPEKEEMVIRWRSLKVR